MLVTVHVDAIVALICESEFCEMFYKLKAGLGKIYLHSIRFATYTVIHNWVGPQYIYGVCHCDDHIKRARMYGKKKWFVFRPI